MRPEVNSNWFEISLQGKIQWGNFIISIRMTSGVMKLIPVQILLGQIEVKFQTAVSFPCKQ